MSNFSSSEIGGSQQEAESEVGMSETIHAWFKFQSFR